MDGTLYALDLAGGRLVWRFDTEGHTLESGRFGFDRRSIQSSPAVAGGRVFVGSRDGHLYAVDAATGKLAWRADHEMSWVNSSPAVARGLVVASSSDNHFVQAVDAATGRERWRFATDRLVWSSPAVAGGCEYLTLTLMSFPTGPPWSALITTLSDLLSPALGSAACAA
jgi:outer membrane protein assembly factor BamB